MKFKNLLIVVLFLLLFPGVGSSADITRNLQKIGTGQAYYLKFIKVYDATLYGEQNRGAGAEAILNTQISKCLHLLYSVDVSREDFAKAANTVLNRQFSKEHLEKLQEDIDTLHDGYQDVQEGDSYTLCYDSATAETTLAHNSVPVVTVPSAEFSRVYFSIWLGLNEPLDEQLRDDLLVGFQPTKNS